MTVYMGSPGRMIALWSTPAQKVSPADPFEFVTTLEGRVKARRSPASRREWSLDASLASPSEQGALMEFVQGAWGFGPWWFIPADAPVVNVLDPGVAALLPGSTLTSDSVFFAGPRSLGADGMAPQSLEASGGAIIQFGGTDTPVSPGAPLTGSAYVQGAEGFVLMQTFDEAGVLMGVAQSGAAGTNGGFVRLSASMTVPAGAVRARLSVRAAHRATRPAVTWTNQMREWGPGKGCEKAVLHGASADLVNVSRFASNRSHSSLSFTVTEVG